MADGLGGGGGGGFGHRLHRIDQGADDDGETHHLDIAAGHRAVIEAGIFGVVIGADFCHIAGRQVAGRHGHGNLMALADIAHIGGAGFAGGGAEAAGGDHARGFSAHIGQQGIHPRHVETAETLVEAAHHLIGHRGAQEADGAAHAGAAGHQHAADADFFRHAVAMHRPAAAKGDHGAALIGLG